MMQRLLSRGNRSEDRGVAIGGRCCSYTVSFRDVLAKICIFQSILCILWGVVARIIILSLVTVGFEIASGCLQRPRCP